MGTRGSYEWGSPTSPTFSQSTDFWPGPEWIMAIQIEKHSAIWAREWSLPRAEIKRSIATLLFNRCCYSRTSPSGNIASLGNLIRIFDIAVFNIYTSHAL